ncbi:hypothetical protein [Brevundimonas sp.]|uniref:hypothetical protein n=1 Tax=Brevundimonas sp. TaxID=1871086 RepID=UPI00289A87C1|nr:hypothetical protein [Brevundimonas sp.]
MTTREEIEVMFVQSRHGRVLFDRQTRLVTAGFEPVYHGRCDFIEFAHPSKNVRSMALGVDGRLAYMFPENLPDFARVLIEPEDDGMFGRWLETAPRPDWWQRFKRQTVAQLGMALAFPAILWGIVLMTQRCNGQ